MTPTVQVIRFEANKRIAYEPGQFISLLVPQAGNEKPIRRLYSLASSPEEAKKNGYELCVKVHPEGIGSQYLASLTPGDRLELFAPYGEFHLNDHSDQRDVCFISTGTGIAPLKAMVQSEQFKRKQARNSLCLFGAQEAKEILFPGVFESVGIETVHALSKENHPGAFHGRLTDYLLSNATTRNWAKMEYYLCGNRGMVEEVLRVLSALHVPESAIHFEAFGLNRPPK